jgi:hypothetical protein
VDSLARDLFQCLLDAHRGAYVVGEGDNVPRDGGC